MAALLTFPLFPLRRESFRTFHELSEIFSDENNHSLSRELLIKVGGRRTLIALLLAGSSGFHGVPATGMKPWQSCWSPRHGCSQGVLSLESRQGFQTKAGISVSPPKTYYLELENQFREQISTGMGSRTPGDSLSPEAAAC